MILVVTQDLKPKKWTETKIKRSQYGLKRKINISEVSEFLILPYTQNRKLGNLGNMSLTSNSDTSYYSRFKNNKNMKWAKNCKVPIWFLKETIKISEISKF